MSSTFLDTQFVLALINERDINHTRAFQLSIEYENRPIITTNAVLLELGNGLARSFREEAIQVLDQLLSSPQVEIIRLSPELFGRGFDTYRRRQDKAWGLVDCISFVVMVDRGITTALTSDHHFAQAGFTVLM